MQNRTDGASHSSFLINVSYIHNIQINIMEGIFIARFIYLVIWCIAIKILRN